MKASPPLARLLIHLKHHSSRQPISGMAAAILPLMLAVCVLMPGLAGPAAAQDVPRVQVFGGYSYTRFDSRSFGFSNQTGMNGYTFSPAYNFIYGFGVVAELSGQYGSKLNLRDLTVGPQFVYPWKNILLFGHLLIGDARSLAQVGNTEEDTARAVAVGGGMDLGISSRFSWRVVQFDYLHTTLFNLKQNNLRFSTGLVYRWGSIKKKGHRTLAPSP